MNHTWITDGNGALKSAPFLFMAGKFAVQDLIPSPINAH